MRRTASAIVLVFILSFSMLTLMVSSTNVVVDSWTALASLPPPHNTISFGAAVAINGKIYGIGEENFFEYNPTNDTWQIKAPRLDHGSSFGYTAAAYKNKIYVIGGWQGQHTEVYDPAKDTVKFSDDKFADNDLDGWHIPIIPTYAEANVVGDKIYVIGGGYPINIFRGSLVFFDETWIYDPTKDYWTEMAPMPTAVMGYASAVVDDNIYIIGGINADGVSDLVQIYDPKTNQWSLGTPIPTAVYYAGASATTGYAAPKRIYVIGGLVQTSNGSQSTNLTQVYDPESDNWSFGASLPIATRYLTLTNVDDILYAINNAVYEKYTPIGYEEPLRSPPPSNPKFPSWIIFPLIILIPVVAIITKRYVVRIHKKEYHNN